MQCNISETLLKQLSDINIVSDLIHIKFRDFLNTVKQEGIKTTATYRAFNATYDKNKDLYKVELDENFTFYVFESLSDLRMYSIEEIKERNQRKESNERLFWNNYLFSTDTVIATE
jgi:hypothetical protein